MNDTPHSTVICKRCLLAELGNKELLGTLEELKAAMPDEDKADTVEYERRLTICRGCDELNDGTCGKCGCYVEFRALKVRMHCPHEHGKW